MGRREELRDHLRLMGQLSESGTAASFDSSMVRPHALAWMFKRVKRDVERILKSTH
ncbi:XAC0095 family protein [Lysobacter sp. 2RAF19]